MSTEQRRLVGRRSPRRPGRPEKRLAIMEAARGLFVREGVDRVSMDAVSRSAGVSKATVYEYFGDKEGLLEAILHEASASLLRLVSALAAEHLEPVGDTESSEALERALTTFTAAIAGAMIGSTQYGAAFALAAQRRWAGAGADVDVRTDPLEAVLADHLRRFTTSGLLDVGDVTVAARQLGALTVLLALDEQPSPTQIDHARLGQTTSAGVRTFMRAFSTR